MPDVNRLACCGFLDCPIISLTSDWVPTRSTNSRTSRRSHVPNAMLSESSIERTWRTPALATLVRPAMSTIRRARLFTLRAYLVLAVALVVAKFVQTGFGLPVPLVVR
jgi:hypothetical protein